MYELFPLEHFTSLQNFKKYTLTGESSKYDTGKQKFLYTYVQICIQIQQKVSSDYLIFFFLLNPHNIQQKSCLFEASD